MGDRADTTNTAAPLSLVIADDDDTIRDGLREIMDWDRLGFRLVADFSDGEELISYLRRYEVDVVLTDIRMSLVSGLEVAAFIHREGLAVKVVLLSGYKEFEYAKQAIRYGVREYLLKPVELEELEAVFGRLGAELRDGREPPVPEVHADTLVARIARLMVDGAVEAVGPALAALETAESGFSRNDSPCALARVVGNPRALTRAFEARRPPSGLPQVRPIRFLDDRVLLFAVGRSGTTPRDLEAEVRAVCRSVAGLFGHADVEILASAPRIAPEHAMRIRCIVETEDGVDHAEYRAEVVEQAKRFIGKHYAEDLSLEDVAGIVHLSSEYFSRLFKQTEGTTFVQYLTATRVRMASELLRTTVRTAGEIGEAVGYKSLSYFSKVFKKHTGHTPTGYRDALSKRR